MWIGVYLYQDAASIHLSGLCIQASQSPGIPGDGQDAPDKTQPTILQLLIQK